MIQGLLAPEHFLEPIDWIMSRTIHRGYLGLTVGDKVFTDLDFADDVSLLSDMLEILVIALQILNEESSQLGLEINWSKMKLQVFDDHISPRFMFWATRSRLLTLGSCIDTAELEEARLTSAV